MRPREIFEVFGEPAAAAEPAEGSFDDPPLRQHLEPAHVVGALDDFERNACVVSNGAGRRRALIAAVGDGALEAWEPPPRDREKRGNHIAILDAGWRNSQIDQEALRIDGGVALLTFDFLARIVA